MAKSGETLRNFRLDDKTWAEVERVCKEMSEELGEKFPPSWLIRRAIREYIERHNERKPKPKK